MTRLYLAGSRAGDVASLFAGSPLETIVMEGAPGSASALKICFAAWSKGLTALLGATRALARYEKVDAALLSEWRHSMPTLIERSEEIVEKTQKAWRWVGEMEEIAAAFAQAGLPPDFHRGAANIYSRLSHLKGSQIRYSANEVFSRLLSSSE